MKTLWIIDDNLMLLESLKMALQDEYYIMVFDDPYVCLAALQAGMPDVVLTDYKMEGMDGLELISSLGRIKNPPKTILFSAVLSQDIAAQAREAGAVACLPKPFDLGELRCLIGKMLEKGAA